MAKASHLLNKFGSGGLGPAPANKDAIDLAAHPKKDAKHDAPSAAAQRPDAGSTLHAPAKAQGGGGQASIRPKV
ncbi:MAG: hypothetical protein HBSAPP03_12020 [Phycisphaerae bacterium]|nr:MAG: hypothetical protein HBSAPP03_12020 [Phycisphaerae bacterium]